MFAKNAHSPDLLPLILTLNSNLAKKRAHGDLSLTSKNVRAQQGKMLLSLAVFIQQLHWLAPAAVMFGTAPCFLMLWWPARILTAVLPRRFYRRADDILFSSYIRLMLFFFENCSGIEVSECYCFSNYLHCFIDQRKCII